MIAHLQGKILELGSESLILDVAGVGYEVFLPVSFLKKVGAVGDVLALKIYTVVREDSLSLFGFLTTVEKQLFIKLISVSGIGPKIAINMLSQAGADALVKAIYSGDLVQLTAVPGIGKKTAERLVIELKDKVLSLLSTHSEKSIFSQNTLLFLPDDLLSALLNLGYNRFEIQEKLKNHSFDFSLPFEHLLKEALKTLGRRG